LVRGPHAGIVLNEVFEGDGDVLFAHACQLGCEGIAQHYPQWSVDDLLGSS
jgi:hypothetical protein